MKNAKLIKDIAFILSCGKEHSACPESWGTPKENFCEFQYAYSHISYVCACLMTRAGLGSVDAEFFTKLLYSAKPDWDTDKWIKETKKLVSK